MEKANGNVTLRATSRTLDIDPTVDLTKAKDNVLGEVRALQPNHESRLEAIERAEKARKKELENRRINLFQKELGAFVQEDKLKKSGGVEETERLRNAKDDRIRKEVWDRQQARNAEMEKAEAEAAAAQAAAAAEEKPDDEKPDNTPTEGDSAAAGNEEGEAEVSKDEKPTEEKTDDTPNDTTAEKAPES